MEQPTKTFECTICNFTCLKNCIYKRHLVSTTHIKNTNPKPKIIYECKTCNFSNSYKKDYDRHLITKKHKKNNPIIENKIDYIEYYI